jgi:hypothetical protein
MSAEYPIVKKDRRAFFPNGGDRRSQRYVNDSSAEDQARRRRVDPLKTGYEPGDDPTAEDVSIVPELDIPL